MAEAIHQEEAQEADIQEEAAARHVQEEAEALEGVVSHRREEAVLFIQEAAEEV